MYLIKYDKQDQQGKAAFNERNPQYHNNDCLDGAHRTGFLILQTLREKHRIMCFCLILTRTKFNSPFSNS
jgi:hypothetical protein